MLDHKKIPLKDFGSVQKLLTRKADSHKGDFGRVLVLGGSGDMPGAVGLCARAALRGGAGLVKMAVPRAARAMAAVICPAATTAAVADDEDGFFSLQATSSLDVLLADCNAIAIGPGMGRHTAGQMILANVLGGITPAIIDADGLNNIASVPRWAEIRQCPCVLTPHPGEMARLCGMTTGKVQADRKTIAMEAAKKWSSAGADGAELVLVLKGHETIVTDGDRIYINTTGNPGMATGGSGDVLTGLVTALIAQGADMFEAAACGVWLHGMAGDFAAEKYGQVSMCSEDILEFLPQAFKDL